MSDQPKKTTSLEDALLSYGEELKKMAEIVEAQIAKNAEKKKLEESKK